MTEKAKAWWSSDGKWFCILANGGVNQATVSLTPEEATNLSAALSAPRVEPVARDPKLASLRPDLAAPPSQPGTGMREALDLLQLQQRGRAKALRLLDGERKKSDAVTLALAQAYEECCNELRAILAAHPAPPDTVRDIAERIAGTLHDFRDMQPEQGETWESWYPAAFDLASEKIRKLTEES